MTLVESSMLPLGEKAPDFCLPDAVSDEKLSLQELKSDVATVVLFICNHCPYVVHIAETLSKLARSYREKGIAFVAISANDAKEYPADGIAEMKLMAEEMHYSFPYLHDETQEIAKAYQAACTPETYVFDADLRCVYRGRFDRSSPGNGIAATGIDLSNALDAVLQGLPISADQKPSMGCSIKWKN